MFDKKLGQNLPSVQLLWRQRSSATRIFCSVVYVKPKSIKIIAEASSKSASRWIFAYSYFAFDVFQKKNAEKNFKNR